MPHPEAPRRAPLSAGCALLAPLSHVPRWAPGEKSGQCVARGREPAERAGSTRVPATRPAAQMFVSLKDPKIAFVQQNWKKVNENNIMPTDT